MALNNSFVYTILKRSETQDTKSFSLGLGILYRFVLRLFQSLSLHDLEKAPNSSDYNFRFGAMNSV